MPEVTVEIEVYCGRCGAGLCNQTEAVRTYMRREQSFRVEPCSKCLQDEYDKGWDQGQREAVIAGEQE